MKVDQGKIKEFLELIREKEIKEKFKNAKLSENTDDKYFEDAIWLGYLDACRTFTKSTKMERVSAPIEYLAKEIKSFIFENKEFDHHEYCKILIDGSGMSFGQAQKIVNMAFKYLYCMVEDEKVQDRFDVCHMPLDGIMLEWIYREVKKSSNKTPKLKKENIGAWSKMNEGVPGSDYDDNNHYTYCYYQKVLERLCNKEKTQLQLDFENWHEMLLTLADEEYIKHFNKDEIQRNIPIFRIEKCVAVKKEESK